MTQIENPTDQNALYRQTLQKESQGARNKAALTFTKDFLLSLVKGQLDEIDKNSVKALGNVLIDDGDIEAITSLLGFNPKEPGAENSTGNRIKTNNFLINGALYTIRSVLAKDSSRQSLSDDEQSILDKLKEVDDSGEKKYTLRSIKTILDRHLSIDIDAAKKPSPGTKVSIDIAKQQRMMSELDAQGIAYDRIGKEVGLKYADVAKFLNSNRS